MRSDPLNTFCDVCNKSVDYMLYPAPDGSESYILTAECHGEKFRHVITDIDAFREATVDCRGVKGSEYVVFPAVTEAPGILIDPKDPMDLGPPKMDRTTATTMGFTGNTCNECGSLQMVRNGTCEKCQTCGATTGCS